MSVYKEGNRNSKILKPSVSPYKHCQIFTLLEEHLCNVFSVGTLPHFVYLVNITHVMKRTKLVSVPHCYEILPVSFNCLLYVTIALSGGPTTMKLEN